MSLFDNSSGLSGSGIAKNAPKKKGFFRYMDIWKNKFWKLIELNLFYTIFLLPAVGAVVSFFLGLNGVISVLITKILISVFAILFVVLFGPATAGLMKVMRNYVIEKPTFMIYDFMKTFKSEFKNAFLIGFLDCLLVCCVASALYIYPEMAKQAENNFYYVLLGVTASVALLAFLMNFYLFLILISTNISMKNVFKNSLYLAIVALKRNAITFLIVGGVIAGIVALLCILPFSIAVIVLTFLPFIPATWLALVVAFNSYPIIQKHIINPYYEQKGEINPELLLNLESDESLFEDMGGKEKPVELNKNDSGKKQSFNSKNHKGKIIS